jgi:hypothetical protein
MVRKIFTFYINHVVLLDVYFQGQSANYKNNKLVSALQQEKESKFHIFQEVM